MKHYHNSGLPGNGKTLPVASLPLFQWAATQHVFYPPPIPECRGAKMLARNFGFPSHMARVHAEHAGFNLEASE